MKFGGGGGGDLKNMILVKFDLFMSAGNLRMGAGELRWVRRYERTHPYRPTGLSRQQARSRRPVTMEQTSAGGVAAAHELVSVVDQNARGTQGTWHAQAWQSLSHGSLANTGRDG